MVVQVLTDNSCLLRDVFTGQECAYSNEMSKKIVGVPFAASLADEQYALWVKFVRACYAVSDYDLSRCMPSLMLRFLSM